MVKTISKYTIVILLIASGILAAIQAITPIYKFAPARQFSGDVIYNPYRGIDSLRWKKANFHAHQRYMLFGLQFEYTTMEFRKAYQEQGYDIIGLADHQQINEASDLPAYEHGYGANNYHLLMLGANKVSWFDYPVMLLPTYQMQYQLNKFRQDAELIAINHASRQRGVPIEVYDNLEGYDLMEMNPDVDATAWDRALSSGIYSTLIANDDTHCIDDRERWFQACYTMVNTPTTSPQDVYKSLREGRAYGVVIIAEQNLKPEPHKGLPTITDISLKVDTIDIAFSLQPDSVRFIGQDARTKSLLTPSDSTTNFRYVFGKMDSYIRIEAYFAGGTKIWTNPFYLSGATTRNPPSVNVLLTVLNSIGWTVLAFGLIWFATWIAKGCRRRKRYDNYYR